MRNFLPNQYNKDRNIKLSHSYLIEQFSDYKKILDRLSKVIQKGDYTLGDQVNLFEKKENLYLNERIKNPISIENEKLTSSKWNPPNLEPPS